MSDAAGTANRLIKQYGDDALQVAASRAEEYGRSRRTEERIYWKNVLIEAKVLLACDYGR